MANELTLSVNGAQQIVSAAPETPLLYVLRNELKLTGSALRLRAGTVRGLRCAGGWRRSSFLHHTGLFRCGQAGDHDRRAACGCGRRKRA